MSTSIERAAEVMREAHDKPHWSPMHRCDNLAQALADAGLLMPDEDERLPSWVYDHPDVWTSPWRVGGVPCLRGTRIPVDIIFNLMDGPDGATDEEIVEFYPFTPADQVARLRKAREEQGNG